MNTKFILGVLISFSFLVINSHGQDKVDSRIFGGSKKKDFDRVIIVLRADGTGSYLDWTGPHSWNWRLGPYKFQWATTSDSLKIKYEWDNAFQFAGKFKNNKLLTSGKGPFDTLGRYILITNEVKKRKAKEILKEAN